MNLVQIPVSVVTPLNLAVTGLEKADFRIYEDYVEQELLSCGTYDAPVSVGLVFDASGSMNTKIGKSREAVAHLFGQANEADEFFLLQFSDRPRLVMPFTRDLEEIQNRLTFTPTKGRTALLDGLYQGIQFLRKAKNPRRAVLVLSDGGDNSSRYTEGEVRKLVREADAQIYAIGIGAGAEGHSLLADMVHTTGGRYFPLANAGELPDIASKIAIELREQYLLSYSPKNTARDGKYRKVKVEVKQLRNMPALRTFHRAGYYAPVS